MSIKTKRVFFASMLLLASAWNCCCLLGLIPFAKWTFSFAIASAASLIVLIPAFFKSGEQSQYHKELAEKEKFFAGITISFLALWVVTILACLVYPL